MVHTDQRVNCAALRVQIYMQIQLLPVTLKNAASTTIAAASKSPDNFRCPTIQLSMILLWENLLVYVIFS